MTVSVHLWEKGYWHCSSVDLHEKAAWKKVHKQKKSESEGNQKRARGYLKVERKLRHRRKDEGTNKREVTLLVISGTLKHGVRGGPDTHVERGSVQTTWPLWKVAWKLTSQRESVFAEQNVLLKNQKSGKSEVSGDWFRLSGAVDLRPAGTSAVCTGQDAVTQFWLVSLHAWINWRTRRFSHVEPQAWTAVGPSFFGWRLRLVGVGAQQARNRSSCGDLRSKNF